MALIPWVMFAITAVLTAVGSVVPAAVAIVAPIALGFAVRYRINPVLMGLMVVNGATAGGFSPISIFGSIVNGVVERNNLESNPTLLFFSSLIFNTLLSVVVFFMFGGRDLLKRRARRPRRREADRALQARDAADAGQPAIAGGARDRPRPHRRPRLNRDRILTLVGIVALVGRRAGVRPRRRLRRPDDRGRALAADAGGDQGRRRARSPGRPCC